MWLKSVAALTQIVVPFEIKAVADAQSAEPHTFEGLAAVFKDKDLGDDIIHKGAFKTTIEEWKDSGEAMPLLNSHDHFNIFSSLGQALSLKETAAGLDSKWEVIDGPEGEAVMRRLRPMKLSKRPLVGKMSIGFTPVRWEIEDRKNTKGFFDQIRHLHEVKLHEVSLVLFPMAPGASIDATSVKSFISMASRTDPKSITPETRTFLRQLNSRIGNLLKQQKSGSQQDDQAEEIEETPAPVDAQTPSEPPTLQPAPVETPAPASTASEQPAESPPAVAAAVPETPASEEEQQYLYAEALQQKIRSVLLRATQSDLESK